MSGLFMHITVSMTINNVLGTGKCNGKDMNKNVIEYKEELHLKLELFLVLRYASVYFSACGH
jgi:nitrogen regulatory protein PII